MTVVDASLVAARFLEKDAGHSVAMRWFENQTAELIAPAILIPEVAAALIRQTGDLELVERVLERITDPDFITIRPIHESLARSSAEMAKNLRLKGCDATYVALAFAEGGKLATLDREQRARGAIAVAMVDL